ncbi:glutathione S-transferase N-terminal domain-containing protein [Luteimonas sp. Y-2-2-4F]|nr:glutathione S-transferase N-terminal domain-containing protein [Luteimonas sp. Y-2-2-4F]MCD9031354.1 glutathione S-transferase N-terminal domain-containing protein [Luteimonas sp. Y-2-2-4F]
MKLYYTPGTCALADHIALEWAGAPYETQRVSREERKSGAFLRLNPAGAVPVLEEDGWVLTQNAAILGYIADRFPRARLAGVSAHERAETQRWLSFVNSDVHPAFHPLFGSTAWLEDDALIARSQEVAKRKLHGQFGILDRQLAGRDWLTGTRSIADPYLFVTLRWARKTGVDLDGLDNLARFFERMQADTGVLAALEAEEGGQG